MARPRHNIDLHGNAPETADTALLLIDLLNDFLFRGGAQLAAETSLILSNLVKLKASARRQHVPVIYVNDNTGRWRSDVGAVLRKAAAARSRGRSVVRRLRPANNDYLVLKPKQSAFFGTPLEILLDYLKVRRLVVAGITADICVFFTAQDAFMRDYELWIPSDGVASESREVTEHSLAQMKQLFHARVTLCSEVEWTLGRLVEHKSRSRA